MDKPETMYLLFEEMISLKKQVATFKRRKEDQLKKTLLTKYNDQLVNFGDIIKDMIEYLENINQKHTATILKMQDKSFISSDNSVQISHLLHQDLINVMQSKNKLQNILQEGLISGKDSIEDLEFIVEEIKNSYTSIRNQYIERLYEFRSAKGLLENIVELKQVDEEYERTMEEKSNNDSDLGCFPHEDQTPDNTPAIIVHFATSSPINNDK